MRRFRRIAVSTAYRFLRLGLHPSTETCSALAEVVWLRRCLTRLRINCVLDVGANEGQFTTRLRRLGYKGWIYSFEPHVQAFEKLAKAHGSDRRWRGFPIALGSKRETKPFYVQRESSLSSFHMPLEASSLVTIGNVEAHRLDEIFHNLVMGISEPRVLLKMDTQGWDVEVVEGAGAVLEQIEALLSELSVQALYEGMVPYQQALELYEERGFRLFDITPINRAADGTIVECDCLMVRGRFAETDPFKHRK